MNLQSYHWVIQKKHLVPWGRTQDGPRGHEPREARQSSPVQGESRETERCRWKQESDVWLAWRGRGPWAENGGPPLSASCGRGSGHLLGHGGP